MVPSRNRRASSLAPWSRADEVWQSVRFAARRVRSARCDRLMRCGPALWARRPRVAAVELHASAGRSSIPWRRRWRRIRRREVPAEAPPCRGFLTYHNARRSSRRPDCRARRSLCPSSSLSRYLRQRRRASNRPIVDRTVRTSVVDCRAPSPSSRRRRQSACWRSTAGSARSDGVARPSAWRACGLWHTGRAGIHRRARERSVEQPFHRDGAAPDRHGNGVSEAQRQSR